MDYIETFDTASENLIRGMRTVQDFAVSAVATVSKTVGGFLPKLDLPMPAGLPRPRQVAEATFRFWQQVGEAQRDFTLKLIDAIYAPLKHGKKTA